MAVDKIESKAAGKAVNILTTYIVKEVLKGSLLALLLLATLVNLFTFSDELRDIGVGAYGFKEVVIYVALTTPKVFYELMPSAALLGSLFVLGAMGNNRELTAMRISGVSLFGLIRAVLLAGLILVLLALAIGELLAPVAERTAKLVRTEAQTENKMVLWQSIYGLWLRDGDMYINVRQILGEGDLADVSIYQLNERNRLKILTHADRARYIGNAQWMLENIRRTELTAQQIVAGHAREEAWQTAIDPQLLNIVVVNPNALSLTDLAMYISFLKENNQKAQTFELAFWGRLINPWIIIVMLLVSTPFVMGHSRMQATGTRMMIGVIIGMGFFVIDRIVGHLGLVYNINPALVAMLPSALVLSGAIYAITRLR